MTGTSEHADPVVPAQAVAAEEQPGRPHGGQILEIRIHGVSNTPPQSTLLVRSADEIELIAGDATTGFYRRVTDDPSARLVTVAYSWGQLTAGLRARKDLERALWMLLLPFALVNVAFWARPRFPGRDDLDDRARTSGLASWLARVLAASLTVTLVLAATGLGADMIAWQWLRAATEHPEQVKHPSWLGFLVTDWWRADTRALAVGLLVPAGALGLLFAAARRSFTYEAALPTEARDNPRRGTPLTSPHFWRGDQQVRALGHAHLAIAASASCATTAGPALSQDWQAGDWHVVPAAVLTVALAATLLAALTLLALPAVTERAPSRGRLGAWLARHLWWVAASLFAATALYLLLPREPLPAASELPGFDATVRALFLVQVLMLSALAAATRWSHAMARVWTGVLAVVGVVCVLVVTVGPDRTDTDPTRRWTVFVSLALLLLLVPAVSWLLPVRQDSSLVDRDSAEPRQVRGVHADGTSPLDQPAWRGTGTPLLAGLGLLLGGLYAAGALFFLGNWLTVAPPETGDRQAVHAPDALGWAAFGLMPFAVVALGFAVEAAVWLRRHSGDAETRAIVDEYGPDSAHARRRARDVARARALHTFVSEQLLTRVGWLGMVAVVGVGLTCAAAATGVAVTELGDGAVGQALQWTSELGTKLALALTGAIVLAGALVYRARPERRGIGIVWDLATFWPRACHPFAPPSYAERVVPQLMTRVSARDYAGFVLAGHSQGAVLALATILQLPRNLRDRVFFLSFGTQLHRLYGRVFPAFFGPVQLHRAAEMLRSTQDRPDDDWLRWQSLHRLTDPLGYPVDIHLTSPTAQVDAAPPDRDPAGLVPVAGEILDPALHGHSDYPGDEAYRVVCDDAAAGLFRRATQGTAGPAPEHSGGPPGDAGRASRVSGGAGGP